MLKQQACWYGNKFKSHSLLIHRGKVAKRVPAPLLGLMNKDAISPSSLELDSTTCDQPVHVPAGHHPTSLKSDASQPSLRDILLRPSSVPKPTPLRPLSPSKHFLSTKGGSLAARVLSQPGANLPASVTPGRKPAAPTVHVQGSTAAQQSGNFSGETWQVHNSSLAETDTDVAELQYTARTSASTQRVARLSPLTTMRDNPLSDSQEDERCPVQLVAAAAVQSIAANHPHRITRASSAAAASSACAVHADAVCAAVPKKSTPAKPGSGTDSAPLAAAVESGASIKAGNGCGPTAAAAGEQPRGHAAKARSTHAGVPAEGAAVAEAIAPVKRKRGRPPKAPAAPEQTSEGASTAQPSSTRHVTANVPAVSKVKKPRLPKATANDKAEDIAAVKVSSTAQEPRDVAAVKPRRGKAAKAAAVEEVPGHTGSAQLSTVPGVLPVTAAVPKPKRGRPRKVITDIEHSSGDLTAGRLGSTSQVAEDAAPIKPRRGRPPKAPAAADHFPKTVAAVKPGGDIVHAAAECVAVPKVRRGQPSKASATRDAAAVKPNSNIHAATDASDVPKAKCNCPPKVSAASEQTSSNTAPPAAPPLPVPKPKQRRAPQAAAAASEPDSGNTTQPSSSTHIRSTAQPKVAKGGIARVTATILTRGSRPQAPSAPQAADSSTSSAKMSCGDQATLAAASSAETSLSATAPRQDPSGTSSAVPEAAGGSDPLQVLAMAAAAASSSPPQQSRPQPFTFKATSSRYICYTAPASVAVSSPLLGVLKA